MTQKRFTRDNSGDLEDNQDNSIYIWEFDESRDGIVELLNVLHEENQELKQRNNNQYNQLKQLWKLIENEDYNTLRSMLNQRETDEQLLQSEWKTYGDWE